MVRRCGKQKQVHIVQTKNPATMINNGINESLPSIDMFMHYRTSV